MLRRNRDFTASSGARFQNAGFDIMPGVHTLKRIMKTIILEDLGAEAERIANGLRRGERMILSFHGKPVGEAVPAISPVSQEGKLGALEALREAQEITSADPEWRKKTTSYLEELQAWRREFGPSGEAGRS